CYNEGDYW
nr:immunoglobulin heavy chain junction region [Macaca mulatta]MPN70202.1 immunoglobulin heavy chain junction region [Macaca mulatta]MPN70654.1 immunoglobulin heavy chain junction region [Macaca mulatta]MPN70756.1 immunoglobulin heavy chain junction region [Macaca mulatta]MPN71622.1 immunoglobulin heavy chain junction region [Macaca mulatta]